MNINMQLSFNRLSDDGEFELFTFDLPKEIIDNVAKNFGLSLDMAYMFAFPRFVDYDDHYYRPIIEYLMNEMTGELEREVVGEDAEKYSVTYSLKNDISDRFEVDQLLLLAAVLHNLDLKAYLVTIVGILMNKHKMEFEEIREICKADALRIDVYEKLD